MSRQSSLSGFSLPSSAPDIPVGSSLSVSEASRSRKSSFKSSRSRSASSVPDFSMPPANIVVPAPSSRPRDPPTLSSSTTGHIKTSSPLSASASSGYVLPRHLLLRGHENSVAIAAKSHLAWCAAYAAGSASRSSLEAWLRESLNPLADCGELGAQTATRLAALLLFLVDSGLEKRLVAATAGPAYHGSVEIQEMLCDFGRELEGIAARALDALEGVCATLTAQQRSNGRRSDGNDGGQQRFERTGSASRRTRSSSKGQANRAVGGSTGPVSRAFAAARLASVGPPPSGPTATIEAVVGSVAAAHLAVAQANAQAAAARAAASASERRVRQLQSLLAAYREGSCPSCGAPPSRPFLEFSSDANRTTIAPILPSTMQSADVPPVLTPVVALPDERRQLYTAASASASASAARHGARRSHSAAYRTSLLSPPLPRPAVLSSGLRGSGMTRAAAESFVPSAVTEDDPNGTDTADQRQHSGKARVFHTSHPSASRPRTLYHVASTRSNSPSLRPPVAVPQYTPRRTLRTPTIPPREALVADGRSSSTGPRKAASRRHRKDSTDTASVITTGEEKKLQLKQEVSDLETRRKALKKEVQNLETTSHNGRMRSHSGGADGLPQGVGAAVSTMSRVIFGSVAAPVSSQQVDAFAAKSNSKGRDGPRSSAGGVSYEENSASDVLLVPPKIGKIALANLTRADLIPVCIDIDPKRSDMRIEGIGGPACPPMPFEILRTFAVIPVPPLSMNRSTFAENLSAEKFEDLPFKCIRLIPKTASPTKARLSSTSTRGLTLVIDSESRRAALVGVLTALAAS